MIFPPMIAELHKLDFDYANGEGIDFEPYSSFLSPEETQSWFRAWTGNEQADGSKLLVFGQDGTGGYAAIWQIKEASTLLDQPVVFLGSEGEKGVVARSFAEYLWLLASGHGPFEAVAYPDDSKAANQTFTEFATAHTKSASRTPSKLLAEADAAYPTFKSWVESQCR
jgi:hypothetical protein